MKKVWNLLFFAFFISCMFLLKPRQDVVFAAMNESQCIRLYEQDREFVLLVEENSTYTGTYTLLNDTLILKYEEQLDLTSNHRNFRPAGGNKSLPSKLYINKSTSQIRSADNRSFSAEIYLDVRGKSIKSAPSRIRILDIQHEEISSIGARP